ncbi:MAG: hypothetical protein IPK82_40160 [Polyangiaceae bacterium]|nr:hypothetical protein [Polyangiaceae bacterium]
MNIPSDDRSVAMSAIAYLTDVEGIWTKLEDFARDNPLVSLQHGSLQLAPGAVLVFGGDAIDRGPASRRVVATLLDAKRRYGDRVVLLAGNRDLNKLRLVRELAGRSPTRAPREVVDAGRAALLKWTFSNTMGAGKAFEMRRAELVHDGAGSSDEDVVRSFETDLAPDGPLTQYLSACALAFRSGSTLFVHGAVTPENLGVVPGVASRIAHPNDWIAELNAFYEAQIRAYRDERVENGTPAWAPIVAYQAPASGTRFNQASVVYGRPADALGNPQLPPRALVDQLQRADIFRVVVGHTPSGDTPSVLCDDDFQLVIADNSYGRTEFGSRVLIYENAVEVSGEALLDSGERVKVRANLSPPDFPVGLRDRATGRLVKGHIGADARLLLFRFLEGFQPEQLAVSRDAYGSVDFSIPRATER